MHNLNSIRSGLSSISFQLPAVVTEYSSKVGSAARYLLESADTLRAVTFKSISRRINHGTFSLDPAFKEQIAAQFTSTRLHGSEAGVAGFAGLFVAFAVSTLVIATLYRKIAAPKPVVNEEKKTEIEHETKKEVKQLEDQFQFLCRTNPACAKIMLENESKRPVAAQAQATLQMIIDGILMDIYNRRNDQEMPPVLNSERKELIETFFKIYPQIDLKFLSGLLYRLSAVWGDEADKYPIFSAIVDYCPGLENVLENPVYGAIVRDYRTFIAKVFEKVPALKQEWLCFLIETKCDSNNLELLEWLVTTYKNDLTTKDFCVVLKKMITLKGVDKEEKGARGLKFFKKVVQENRTLQGPEMNKMLKLAVDLEPEMFKFAITKFTHLKRENFTEILADEKTPREIAVIIKRSYPEKK